MRRRYLGLLATAAGVGAALLVWSFLGEGSQSVRSQGDSLGERIIWRNVSIPTPTNELLIVGRTFPPRPGDPFLIRVILEAEASPDSERHELTIDADTGEIRRDTLSDVNPEDVAQIVENLIVGTQTRQIWPYIEGDPPSPARTLSNIAYPEVGGSSGIVLLPTYSYCTSPDCAAESLFVSNGYAGFHIDAATGEAMPVATVPGGEPLSVEDEIAFTRFAESIVVLDPAPTAIPSPTTFPDQTLVPTSTES